MTAGDDAGAEGADPQTTDGEDAVDPLEGASSLLDVLRASGASEGDITQAQADGLVELLAIEYLAVPEPALYDVVDLAETTGMPTSQIVALWRSLGFAEPRPGDHVFTVVDADMLHTVAEFVQMGIIEPDLAVQMARVIGSSLARVASALVDAIDPADATVDLTRDEDFAATAGTLLPTIPQIMDYVWRRHLQAEARRRVARSSAGADPDFKVVGFADLVGFTALSQQISSHELAAVVDRFESIAYDTVSSLGGRVVKMIGDEVMFSIDNPRAATEIAVTLAEMYRDDDELSDVRVGLAAGPVLTREADIFGPVVNRASRIVGIAFPGSVVASDELHEALGEDPSFTWKPIGTRRLKDIGKVSLWVVRRPDAEPGPKSSREEAAARRSERRERVVEELAERRDRGTAGRGHHHDDADPSDPG
ncbi:MAG TPA: adenylate/guanylate cyclase domain-containing protein [Acidimicrobiales bacterium]